MTWPVVNLNFEMVNFFFLVWRQKIITPQEMTPGYEPNRSWETLGDYIQLRVSHATELGSSSRRAGELRIGKNWWFWGGFIGWLWGSAPFWIFRCQFFVDSKTNCLPLPHSFLIIFDIQLPTISFWISHMMNSSPSHSFSHVYTQVYPIFLRIYSIFVL